MQLRDAGGATFDSRDIEATTERFQDSDNGELARVRLSDGTVRVVAVFELELAAREDWADATFLAKSATSG